MQRVRFAKEFADALGAIAESGRGRMPADEEFAVVTKADEKRITVGVMYPADTVDAHGEFAKAEDLEQSVYDYVQAGDLRLRKQHSGQLIGHIVGIMPWPFEAEVELKQLGGGLEKSKRVKLPAGTVFAAARWTPEAWEDVKSGRIRGFSMGGRAMRIAAA